MASISTSTNARNADRFIATNAAAIDARIVDRKNEWWLVNAGERYELEFSIVLSLKSQIG